MCNFRSIINPTSAPSRVDGQHDSESIIELVPTMKADHHYVPARSADTARTPAGPSLIPDVLGVCARFLFADQDYETLTNLNNISYDVQRVTNPVAKHTVRLRDYPREQPVSASRIVNEVAQRFVGSQGYQYLRFVVPPVKRIPISHCRRNEELDGIIASANSAPDITILARFEKEQEGTRGPHHDDINLVRLGTRYRPFSDESSDFYSDHVATDTPRQLCESNVRSQSSGYETILIAPPRLADSHHIQKTMDDIDNLFASSHARLLQDVEPRRETRNVIGKVQLLKLTEEPYDVDCLYLMTMEVLRLAARYDARLSQIWYEQMPLLQFDGIIAEEAKVILSAFSRAISVHTSYAEARVELCLIETGKASDLKRWIEPIKHLHEPALLANSIKLQVTVFEHNPLPEEMNMPDWIPTCIWEFPIRRPQNDEDM